jgi:hypothetical protein
VANKPSQGLYRNTLSYFGGLIVFGNAILIAFAMIAELSLKQPSPYVGIFTYMIFPGFLTFGAALLLYGMRRESLRRRRARSEEALPYPKLDLNDPKQRKRLGYVLVGGGLLWILLAFTGYNAFLFTESVTFCGALCHPVMKPEYTAYKYSPHARVRCVDCHVGEGASWYVKSKFSGVRQVLAVTLGTYKRPIPTPVENLRPARETCEQCHWPQKFYGAQLQQRPHFRYDEANTAEQISLLIKTGGGTSDLGQRAGIHWHMIIDAAVTFAALDKKQQEIPWTRVKRIDGTVDEYWGESPPVTPEKLATLEKRSMDCMDCHNRPTHAFEPPDFAMDKALASGLVARDLPWIKKVAVEALVRPYPNQQAAHEGIRREILEHYRSHNPELARARSKDLDKAAEVAIGAYDRAVFPEMRVDWKTYPSNIGHRNWPGCFRCHDGRHKTREGKVLSGECTLCHTMPQRGPLAPLGNVMPTATEDWHPWDLAKHLSIKAHGNTLCHTCHSAGYIPRKECGECHK